LVSENKTPLTLGTIYRVLDQLEKAGIILCHHFSADNAVYELHDSDHHDQMIDVTLEELWNSLMRLENNANV